ncbi:MAG: Glycine cleavage system H protein [Syntrophaceae bacterium PtaB.Bin095]|jgi:glycine cleavage system H protein|nr:MAG: Glycine cleavage system H protein [Syntrophaceae bacterium PtaB.Bin095]
MKVFPDDLLYSREHVWVRVDGDLATIGITDYAQENLGEVVSIELPEADSEVEQDEPFGTVESSTKGVVELVSPVSGEVISVNEDIADDIGIINSDPHDTGWLIIVEMSDMEELAELLDAKGYNDFVARETEGG